MFIGITPVTYSNFSKLFANAPQLPATPKHTRPLTNPLPLCYHVVMTVPLPPNPASAPPPATATDVKAMLKNATPQAIQQIIALANSRDPKVPASVKLAAAQEILNREMGKTTQPIEANGSISVIINQINQARYEPKKVIDADFVEV